MTSTGAGAEADSTMRAQQAAWKRGLAVSDELRKAARAVRQTTTSKPVSAWTRLSDRALVLHTDALGFLSGLEQSFDLIYVAPPQYKGIWIEALRLISTHALLPDKTAAAGENEGAATLVIAQIDPKEYESLDLGALREVRQKRYGNTLLVFYASGSGNDREEGHVDC